MLFCSVQDENRANDGDPPSDGKASDGKAGLHFSSLLKCSCSLQVRNAQYPVPNMNNLRKSRLYICSMDCICWLHWLVRSGLDLNNRFLNFLVAEDFQSFHAESS